MRVNACGNGGAGMDELLARHFAHLFIRDPLVIYREKVELDDAASSDHFEVRAACRMRVLTPRRRTSSRPTGRRCASSRRRHTAPLVGRAGRRAAHDCARVARRVSPDRGAGDGL